MKESGDRCPRCGKIMIEKPPGYIYLTDPPQYELILWCGCGYTENRGRVTAPTEEETLRKEWERINHEGIRED